MARFSEYPRPSHRILHLSDLHLTDQGSLYGDIDSEARLRSVIDDIISSRVRADAIVLSGDLADRGEAAAYQTLRSMIDPLAREVGGQIIWAMGNHDDRAQFRTHLLDTTGSTEPVDAVHDLRGLRVITLDTTVPGCHHGEVTDEQLAWLADVVAVPAALGSILVMHHPPMPSVLDLSVLVELREQHRLAEVLRGSDVRMILAGHLHYSTFATFAGIPVSVSAATCYTQDLTVVRGTTRGRDAAQGYNVVHVHADTVVTSVVPPGGGALVGELVTPDQTAVRLAHGGVDIAPAPVTIAPRVRESGSSA
nr:phosphodiesterase [Williamsia sp. CHRR-6]